MPTSDDEIFNECLTLGPMARYAEDLSLAARIMLSTRDRDLRLDVPVDLDRLKIYYRKNMDETIGILPIAEDMEQCVVRATNHFAQRGVRAEQVRSTGANYSSRIKSKSNRRYKCFSFSIPEERRKIETPRRTFVGSAATLVRASDAEVCNVISFSVTVIHIVAIHDS